jgi:hypothetical protein
VKHTAKQEIVVSLDPIRIPGYPKINLQQFRTSQDPLFFNLFVEQRHMEHLERKDIDEESRLEVVYRILKD